MCRHYGRSREADWQRRSALLQDHRGGNPGIECRATDLGGTVERHRVPGDCRNARCEQEAGVSQSHRSCPGIHRKEAGTGIQRHVVRQGYSCPHQRDAAISGRRVDCRGHEQVETDRACRLKLYGIRDARRRGEAGSRTVEDDVLCDAGRLEKQLVVPGTQGGVDVDRAGAVCDLDRLSHRRGSQCGDLTRREVTEGLLDKNPAGGRAESERPIRCQDHGILAERAGLELQGCACRIDGTSAYDGQVANRGGSAGIPNARRAGPQRIRACEAHSRRSCGDGDGATGRRV